MSRLLVAALQTLFSTYRTQGELAIENLALGQQPRQCAAKAPASTRITTTGRPRERPEGGSSQHIDGGRNGNVFNSDDELANHRRYTRGNAWVAPAVEESTDRTCPASSHETVGHRSDHELSSACQLAGIKI
jgi:hypothetical protein